MVNSLNTIAQLIQMDPGKKVPDIWIFSEDSTLSFHEHMQLVKTASSMIPVDRTPPLARTALVATNKFQAAELQLCCEETENIPFEMKAFGSREEAIDWILEKPV